MSLFQELARRTRAVKLGETTNAPDGKVASHEQVVGILPDRVKVLYVATWQMLNELGRRCTEFHPTRDRLLASHEAGQQLTEADFLAIQAHQTTHDRITLLKDHFWLDVREAFPNVLFQDGGVGLCEGWQVVTWSRLGQMAQRLRELITDPEQRTDK